MLRRLVPALAGSLVLAGLTWSTSSAQQPPPIDTSEQLSVYTGVVDKATARFKAMKEAGETVTGARITDLVTVNGVRVSTEDGTWGHVRASSNKPELVVVVESPVSEERLRAMFKAVDGVLRENPEVGAYNQSL